MNWVTESMFFQADEKLKINALFLSAPIGGTTQSLSAKLRNIGLLLEDESGTADINL